MTTVMLVAGARPNYMKIAPIVWAARRVPDLAVEIVHTGQHYDPEMSDSFFRDLDLPAPVVNLGVGSAPHGTQTAMVMARFEPVVLERRPDAVVVVGDVNSTLAAALVTAKLTHDDGARRPLLAHVEAGLRSRDWSMPEEVNRVLTDQVSDLLLTTCRDAEENLAAEGIARERIRLVGNPMIDSLRACLPRAQASGAVEAHGLASRPFALCTLHRPSNVDDRDVLAEILAALAQIARELTVVLPLHPRTRARVEEFGLGDRLAAPGIVALQPLSYLPMLALLASAHAVLTDSGGIQEETTALGIPCVTLRHNTERPVTISEGTNVLGGTTRQSIMTAWSASRAKAAAGARIPELWDGKTGPRIVAALVAALEQPALRAAQG